MFLIGSNSINTAGDLYAFGINAITKPTNQRVKRLLDLVLAALFLVLSPIIIWMMKRPFGLLKNLFLVLIGKRTWVGYIKDLKTDRNFDLPKISDSVLNPLDGLEVEEPDEKGLSRLNMLYAKDYRVANDLNIVFKGFRNLGR